MVVVVVLLELILPPAPLELAGVALDIAPEDIALAELESVELPIEAELSVPIALELAELSVPIALEEAELSVAELSLIELSLDAALSAMPAELSAFALLSVEVELSADVALSLVLIAAELSLLLLDSVIDVVVEVVLSLLPPRFINA